MSEAKKVFEKWWQDNSVKMQGWDPMAIAWAAFQSNCKGILDSCEHAASVNVVHGHRVLQWTGEALPVGAKLYASCSEIPNSSDHIADANKMVADDAVARILIDRVVADLDGGFVACNRCGDQEDTATLDCMGDLKRLQEILAHPASAQKEIERWKVVAHDQAETISELQNLIHANHHEQAHQRVHEYDGAHECLDCGAQWGALPGNPKEPEHCAAPAKNGSVPEGFSSLAEATLAGCKCVLFGKGNRHWPCPIHASAVPERWTIEPFDDGFGVEGISVLWPGNRGGAHLRANDPKNSIAQNLLYDLADALLFDSPASDRPTLGRRKAEQVGEIIGVLVQTEPGKVTAVTDMGRCTLLHQDVTGAGEEAQHIDDIAVDHFADAMKQKLAKQRQKGYGGWNDKELCPDGRLQKYLGAHLGKGDPVDIGNFAMMIWNRGESVTGAGDDVSWSAEMPTKPARGLDLPVSVPTHALVYEYDGAVQCLRCGAQWGALPGNPKEPAQCVPAKGGEQAYRIPRQIVDWAYCGLAANGRDTEKWAVDMFKAFRDAAKETIALGVAPIKADEWIKCSERQPLLGQRVILEKQGVVQIYMPEFDVDCNGYFWDFEDVNGVDNPRVDYEKRLLDATARYAKAGAGSMSTPETIYLIPGEDIEGYPGMMWCESSAPSDHCDPDEAAKYLRFDIHESILKRQGNAAKMGMDAANKDAIWREENAKKLLAESNPAALESELAANADLTAENELLQDALIGQGKMLSAIVNITKGPPEENTLHSTHDAVESVERLQARVAELEDLFKYAQVQSGVCMCGEEMHKHGYFSDHTPFDVWDHAVDKTNEAGSTGAFIKRKQADAIDAFLNHPVNFDIHDPAAIIKKLEVECKRLRNEADKAGGDSE